MSQDQSFSIDSGMENTGGSENQSPAGQAPTNAALGFINEFNRNAQLFNINVLPKLNRLEAELNLLYERLNTIRDEIRALRGSGTGTSTDNRRTSPTD